jgi:hypothetical protein
VKAAFAALALALGLAFAARAAAPALPAAVMSDVGGLRPLGEARLRVFLVPVYDASLWSDGGRWSPDGTYALDIRYLMDVRGADLAAKSVELMRALGYRDEPRLARWKKEMGRVFPDIRAGDRLVGVNVPGREARFYGDKGLLGTVPDTEFARAFFAIWLDERTSEPAMRRQLLEPAP